MHTLGNLDLPSFLIRPAEISEFLYLILSFMLLGPTHIFCQELESVVHTGSICW